MAEKTKRRRYSIALKLRAIRALEKRSPIQVAKDLGLPYHDMLYAWRGEKDRFLEQQQKQRRGAGAYFSQATLLKRAIKRAVVERDILRKAILYFGKRERTRATRKGPHISTFRFGARWLASR